MGSCASSEPIDKIYRKSSRRNFICDRKEHYASERRTNNLSQNLVNEEFKRRVNDVYDLRNGRSLGVGSFATVRAVVHRNSGKEFALKTIEIKGIKDVQKMHSLIREIDIMKKLDHPSVARLQEVFYSNDCVFIIMDLYSGGDLVDRQHIKTEHDTAVVMKKIVDGIRYCHDRQIAHRDLKLENILYDHPGPDAGIKIVDFGLGVDRPEATLMRDIVGTWVYMSPELLKGRHSPFAADMWSLGVIAYTLISGKFPFHADSLQMLQHRIQHDAVDFNTGNWTNASAECIDFISKLLEKDPSRRMKAAEAQLHPWLTFRCKSFNSVRFRPLTEDVAARLKSFKDQSVIKRVALEVVARTLGAEEISYLEEEFRKADKDGLGELTMPIFRKVMKESAFLRDSDIDLIFKSLDVEGNGCINFNEFLAAGLKWQELDERQLRLAFDRLDNDNTGSISVENLQVILGCSFSIDEIKLAIEDFDLNKKGKIGFDEFCVGMRKSGADISALGSTTVFTLNNTAMSKIISRTTLERLIKTSDVDSDNEMCMGNYRVDELYTASMSSSFDSVDKLTQPFPVRPSRRSSVSTLCSRFQSAALSECTESDDFRSSRGSIILRRATSDTGINVNRSLCSTKLVPRQKIKTSKRRSSPSIRNSFPKTCPPAPQKQVGI